MVVSRGLDRHRIIGCYVSNVCLPYSIESILLRHSFLFDILHFYVFGSMYNALHIRLTRVDKTTANKNYVCEHTIYIQRAHPANTSMCSSFIFYHVHVCWSIVIKEIRNGGKIWLVPVVKRTNHSIALKSGTKKGLDEREREKEPQIRRQQ